MAGHSKWANIKHKKAAQDAKRGKVFSKLVKKISSAARRGGGDLDANAELRLMVDKARAVNMPSDNIERAILKATGQLEGVSYEDFSYEGYGPGGVAIQLEGSTDNRNRTVAEIRHAFTKNGGNMGENGCVAWMFHTKGVLAIEADHVADPDSLMELALENGADDFEESESGYTLTCEQGDYVGLRNALGAAGYEEFVTDEITKIPETTLCPDGIGDVRSVMKMLDIFEDHDDIENIYTNFDVSDEIAAQLDE